jgi:hypothetical protein
MIVTELDNSATCQTRHEHTDQREKHERNAMALRIRKGSLTKDEWLKRDGTWTENYKEAAKFTTESAVEKFLAKHPHVGEDYGVF